MSSQNHTPQFGFNLRRLREAKGLTRQQLADAIGCTWRYVEKLEAGRINPYLSVAAAAAAALDVRIEKFLENPRD